VLNKTDITNELEYLKATWHCTNNHIC